MRLVTPCVAWGSLVKKTLRYAQGLTAKGKARRKRFLKRQAREQHKKTPIVYIDETGFSPQIHRTHGYSSKGHKVHGQQSAHSRPRTSLIGGYRDNKLIAPMLFNGTCNTTLFHDWLEQMLLPQLVTGTIIVLDNATFHKSQHTQTMVEQCGCELLFLPPYSPDLNPIEKLWGNIKRARRNSQHSLDSILTSSDYSWV
jgi:transposase